MSAPDVYRCVAMTYGRQALIIGAEGVKVATQHCGRSHKPVRQREQGQAAVASQILPWQVWGAQGSRAEGKKTAPVGAESGAAIDGAPAPALVART